MKKQAMKKRIHMLLLLLLTMLCLGGCGRQGKVSNKLFEQALDAYQDYYRDVAERAEKDCGALISLDTAGLPVMAIVKADIALSSTHERAIDIELCTFVKGKVQTLMEETVYPDRHYGSEGFTLYSDGVVGIKRNNETIWYQVKGDKLEELGYCDKESQTATFHVGRKNIKINLLKDDPLKHKDVYAKICKKLYQQKTMGTDYGKDMWLLQLQETEYDIKPAFFQSPVLGKDWDRLNSTMFLKMLSKLKQHGSMTNEEFLVWYYKYLIDSGIDEPGKYLSAARLVFRNPMLLNELGDFMYHDKERSQIYLLSYLTHTRNWKMAKQIKLFTDLDRSQLEKWLSLNLHDYTRSILFDDQPFVDQFFRNASWYQNMTPDMYRDDSNDYPTPESKYIRSQAFETYSALPDNQNNVASIQSYIQQIDKLPKLIETWQKDYTNSDQMKKDYYEAYLREHYGENFEENYLFRGFAFVKMGEKSELCLLGYGNMGTQGQDTLVLLTLENNHVNFYSDEGFFFWDDNIKGIYTITTSHNLYTLYRSWTVKNGKLYNFTGKKEESKSASDDGSVRYYLFDEAGELSYDTNMKVISEQEYNKALKEYSDLTQYPKLVPPGYIPTEYEPSRVYGETYATIEEAYEAYLQNPTVGFQEIVHENSNAAVTPSASPDISVTSDSQLTLDTLSEAATEPQAAEVTEENPIEQQSEIILDINVDEEVTQIRAWFYETQNKLNSYSSEDDGDVLRYYDNGYLIKMVVDKGYHNWDYTREYYFHDGELYFAFMFDGSEEHRLYFKNNQLIRYIDENKNTYNYGDTEQFSDWSVPVIAEAYDLSQ